MMGVRVLPAVLFIIAITSRWGMYVYSELPRATGSIRRKGSPGSR